MRRGYALATVAAIGLVAAAPDAQAAPKVERFKVVALAGAQSSDVTWRLADEEAGTTCMRTATENVSFALGGPVVAHVSKRRSHGKLRSVWSESGQPGSPFEVIELPVEASVSRRITSRGPCAEADCSADSQIPWTIQFTGAMLDAGGARLGAGPISGEGLEWCAYDGIRALETFDLETDFNDPAAHLFEAKELFDRDKKRITSTETFAANQSLTDGSSTSRVEITATIKRLKPASG